MPTINQLNYHGRESKRRTQHTRALIQCPQKQGVCLRISTRTPKKPNSALRKIARATKGAAGRSIYIYIFLQASVLFPNVGPPIINGVSRMRGDLHVWFLGGFLAKVICKVRQRLEPLFGHIGNEISKNKKKKYTGL